MWRGHYGEINLLKSVIKNLKMEATADRVVSCNKTSSENLKTISMWESEDKILISTLKLCEFYCNL